MHITRTALIYFITRATYWRGRLPIIRTREVQAVVCNHSLHRVYVIYTLGDCTLLELANHVYYVVGRVL